MRHTILTLEGHWFDFQNPQPHQVTLSEIATVLGQIRRFGGHSLNPVSVAEHCVAVWSDVQTLDEYKGLDPDTQRLTRLWALLHDAPEAYTGDVVTPLKSLLGPSFAEVEDRVERVILQYLDLSIPTTARDLVHRSDQRVLGAEMIQIRGVEPKALLPTYEWIVLAAEGVVLPPRPADPAGDWLSRMWTDLGPTWADRLAEFGVIREIVWDGRGYVMRVDSLSRYLEIERALPAFLRECAWINTPVKGEALKLPRNPKCG